MNNGVTLTSIRLSSLHDATHFHDIVAIGSRFYEDVRETEIKLGYLMGWAVNNITLKGYLEIILEGVSDIRNANAEVVSDRDGNN